MLIKLKQYQNRLLKSFREFLEIKFNKKLDGYKIEDIFANHINIAKQINIFKNINILKEFKEYLAISYSNGLFRFILGVLHSQFYRL